MSLILEALKKSEDKRRLGAAPDLATPFSARRRRNWVWPIAAVLVAAGLVAWALRPSPPPPQAPAVAAAPSKNDASHLRAVTTPGQKSGAPLRSVTGANDQTPSAPPGNLPKPAGPPPGPPAGTFAVGQRDPNAPTTAASGRRRGVLERNGAMHGGDRPGSEGPPPAVGIAAKMPPPPPPQKVSDLAARTAPPPPVAALPRPAPVAPPSNVPAPPPNVASPKTDATAMVAAPGRAAKSPSTVGLTPPTAAKTTAATTSSAQPYSELPFSVRKSLPELKLSMHVYAADPPHRFVVLNDSRLTEGEKTSDDIFVREIRPDGVVLEFQNQRFFYPRDGL
jgi:general secretion pathway protein B